MEVHSGTHDNQISGRSRGAARTKPTCFLPAFGIPPSEKVLVLIAGVLLYGRNTVRLLLGQYWIFFFFFGEPINPDVRGNLPPRDGGSRVGVYKMARATNGEQAAVRPPRAATAVGGGGGGGPGNERKPVSVDRTPSKPPPTVSQLSAKHAE